MQKEKEKIEMKNLANMGSGVSASVDENDDEDISKSAFASFQAREEEIEKMKMQVKEKVEMKLGQAEEQTRRLAQVWEELEVLTDPMRKEVASVRKKIDVANREVRSLGQSCQKKVWLPDCPPARPPSLIYNTIWIILLLYR